MNLPLGKAAAAIGVHPDTMRSYCERGYVDAWRLPSGRWRIDKNSLDDLRRSKSSVEETAAQILASTMPKKKTLRLKK